MNDIKEFREKKLKKMSDKDKESGFSDFLNNVNKLNLNRDKELETLYKIRGGK